MNKVLYIKANAKNSDESRTFKISDSFINQYKITHPNDEIITLDLYQEEIDFLPNNQMKEFQKAIANKEKEHPILKYAFQFLEADKYIIAAPLWNLSIPAILKAYIDYITISGITFKYSAHGPIGLCQNKKAINIVTRGGVYNTEKAASLEMGDRYLKTIFNFLGIEDYSTIVAEGLDIIGNDVDELVNQAIIKAQEKAKSF